MTSSVKKVSLQQMNLAIFFLKLRRWASNCRIHADEIESIGGVDVAAELESTSAEHLMVITDEGIQKLAAAKVIGNLLPAQPSASWKIPMHRLVRCWMLGWPLP